MMRRYSLTAHRLILAIAATFIASLAVATTAAQGLVVNDTNPGGTEAGVALVPGARNIATLPSGVSAVTASGSCTDPWLTSDLGGPLLPGDGLCYRGGGVMHKNETFALTWDAPIGSTQRNYWALTRGYVEQYLKDVADSSGSLGTPYAMTPQYSDNGGRAQNASVFGGGCIDYGAAGGSACEFGNPTGAGHNYPSPNSCTARGDSFIALNLVYENQVCLTDADVQAEVSTMVSQTGILGRTQPGYTPLVTLLLPPGVETCLDTGRNLCSTNANLTPPPPVVSANAAGGSIPAGTYQVEVTYALSGGGESPPSSAQTVTTTGSSSTITVDAPPQPPSGVTGWNLYITGTNGTTFWRQASNITTFGSAYTQTTPPAAGPTPPSDAAFCSYHSQVDVGGTEVPYVVQPWTAGTACDEPGIPNFPNDPTPEQMSIGVGARLVSPLSQSEIAAITNPGLNGWAALSGWEIDDNGSNPAAGAGCTPLPRSLDSVTVGTSSQNPYFLQREFNNAGAIEFDPVTYFGCAPVNTFGASFVVPSSVDQGDAVEFDGSSTASTLIVPNQGYAWDFGDGSKATGASVVHTYTQGGTYNVTLTVTDRGGNVSSITQSIQVLGSTGQAVLPPSASNSPGTSSGGATPSGTQALSARLQLLPQSLKAVFRNGIAVRVTSNLPANGIATVSITRISAKKAGIKVGRNRAVRIGIGTVASIKNGTITLHLHLSNAMVKKLSHLKHVALTVRLALVAAGNQRFAIDAAGRY